MSNYKEKWNILVTRAGNWSLRVIVLIFQYLFDFKLIQPLLCLLSFVKEELEMDENCGRQSNISQRHLHPNTWNLRIHYLSGKRDFADVIKVKDSELGRLSWFILMSPNQSHDSLKAENLPWLLSERGCDYSRMVREIQRCCRLWRWKEATAKERGLPLEAGRPKEMNYLLEILKRRAALLTFDISPGRLMSDSYRNVR